MNYKKLLFSLILVGSIAQSPSYGMQHEAKDAQVASWKDQVIAHVGEFYDKLSVKDAKFAQVVLDELQYLNPRTYLNLTGDAAEKFFKSKNACNAMVGLGALHLIDGPTDWVWSLIGGTLAVGRNVTAYAASWGTGYVGTPILFALVAGRLGVEIRKRGVKKTKEEMMALPAAAKKRAIQYAARVLSLLRPQEIEEINQEVRSLLAQKGVQEAAEPAEPAEAGEPAEGQEPQDGVAREGEQGAEEVNASDLVHENSEQQVAA